MNAESLERISVRSSIPVSDGIYLKGLVEKVPVTFVVDTGAEKTIISKKIFSKIDKQPSLAQKGGLLHAGGAPLKDYGICTLNIQLDNVTFLREVIIADIQDDALLGIDIMRNKDGKISDILMSKNKIVIDGEEISCFQPKSRSARRVSLADDYEVQGHTEQILDVFIERYIQWNLPTTATHGTAKKWLL